MDRVYATHKEAEQLVEINQITIEKNEEIFSNMDVIENLLSETEEASGDKEEKRNSCYDTHEETMKNVFENMNKSKENIKNSFEEFVLKTNNQKLNVRKHVLLFDEQIKSKLLEMEKKSKQAYEINTEENGKLKTQVDLNDAFHKETLKDITVTKSSINDNEIEIEEGFSKLLFIQSKNSHNHIANQILGLNNKVKCI